MITLFKNNQECCGCTACYSICPENAIAMVEDKEGFLYPTIDTKRCINCGLCKQVCDFQAENSSKNSLNYPLAYAAKHKNEEVRISSTSGGVFTAISDYILSLDGIIYGVALDKNWKVIHDRAETKETRDSFKGSKYVQSNITGIFYQVEKDLLNKKTVLFTGTPCQCAGLKSYLGYCKISTNNLVLCDMVCHGVPSPKLWDNHIYSLKKKYNAKIISYHFRSKINGWRTHTEKVVFSNGDEDCSTGFSQRHKYIFHSLMALRPACHNCKYASVHRTSDLTIADFWGIEKTMPEFDDNKGVSLILVNSDVGRDVLNKIKPSLALMVSDMDACLQPQLQYPTLMSRKRKSFWKDYHEKGYDYVIKKYTPYGIRQKLKTKLIKVIITFFNLFGKREGSKNI